MISYLHPGANWFNLHMISYTKEMGILLVAMKSRKRGE